MAYSIENKGFNSRMYCDILYGKETKQCHTKTQHHPKLLSLPRSEYANMRNRTASKDEHRSELLIGPIQKSGESDTRRENSTKGSVLTAQGQGTEREEHYVLSVPPGLPSASGPINDALRRRRLMPMAVRYARAVEKLFSSSCQSIILKEMAENIVRKSVGVMDMVEAVVPDSTSGLKEIITQLVSGFFAEIAIVHSGNWATALIIPATE